MIVKGNWTVIAKLTLCHGEEENLRASLCLASDRRTTGIFNDKAISIELTDCFCAKRFDRL